MSFEQLNAALTETSVQDIQPDEAAFQGKLWDNQTALNIVRADVRAAEEYYIQFVKSAMDETEGLYKGRVKQMKWANGKSRSALSMPVILDATEKLIASLHTTLWGGKRPFAVAPTGKTSPQAARAKEKLLLWAVKESGLEEEMRLTLKSCLQYGYCLGEWGWETSTIRRKAYTHGDGGAVVGKMKEIKLSRPFYRNLDLHKSFIDPKLSVQDPRKGSFYVKQTFLTGYDLHGLRDDSNYQNIPTDEEIALSATQKTEPTQDSVAGSWHTPQELQAKRQSEAVSSDPLLYPFEYVEYWNDDCVVGVLQAGPGGIIIRNQLNEFGRKTCVGCAFIDVLNSAHGFGTGRLLAGEQYIQTGTVNTWMDAQALVMNPVFQLLKGTGIGAQSIEISPGKLLNVTGEMKQIDVKSTTPEAMAIIESSQDRAFRRVAANGGMNVLPQTLRTGAGVSSVNQDVTTRLQYFLNIFINMVFVPVLEAFLELLCDKMTPEQINEILTQEQGKAFEGDEILDVYNATCRVEIVSGSKLTSRDAASQLAPLIMQMLMAEPVQTSLATQNKKWDYLGFFEEVCDRLGWDAEPFIIEMEPADQQRWQSQQSGPAQIKAQLETMLEQMRQQGALDQIDRKGDVKLASDAFKAVLKGHSDDQGAKLQSALSRQEANQEARNALIQPGTQEPNGQ